MSDTQVQVPEALSPDQIEKEAREAYFALKAQVERELQEIDSGPEPSTPALDRARREREREQKALEDARRERARQRAALVRTLDQAREAFTVTLEKAQEAKRRARDEANKAAVLDFARKALDRDQSKIETPQERAALKLRQLTGLPITSGDFRFGGSAGGGTILNFSFHGLSCTVIDTVDEPAQLWTALPVAAGRIIQDARDLVSDCLKFRLAKPGSAYRKHHAERCITCRFDYEDENETEGEDSNGE